MGPASLPENVGAIRSVDSGEESGACGDSGRTSSTPDDAETPRTCSNVARAGSQAAGPQDATDAVATMEVAIGELDAGRTEAAKARLKAFVAATRGPRGA